MADVMSRTKEAKMLSKSFGPSNFLFILFFSKLNILFKFYFDSDSQRPTRLGDTTNYCMYSTNNDHPSIQQLRWGLQITNRIVPNNVVNGKPLSFIFIFYVYFQANSCFIYFDRWRPSTTITCVTRMAAATSCSKSLLTRYFPTLFFFINISVFYFDGHPLNRGVFSNHSYLIYRIYYLWTLQQRRSSHTFKLQFFPDFSPNYCRHSWEVTVDTTSHKFYRSRRVCYSRKLGIIHVPCCL